MNPIPYEINNPFFPYDFAQEHFRAADEAVEWYGRLVHQIVGVLELIPVLNLIVALFDKFVHDFCCAAPEMPLPPPPAESIDDDLRTYCAEVLGMATDVQFSETLQCRPAAFAVRGLHTVEDFTALGLSILSTPLKQVEAELASLRARNTELVARQGDNPRQTAGSIRSDIFGLLDGLEEGINEILTCKNVEPLAETQERWAPFLERIAQLRAAFSTHSLADRTAQIDELALLAADLNALDAERQTRWLKAYLLQIDIVRFWRNPPGEVGSLATYVQATESDLPSLFELGINLPPLTITTDDVLLPDTSWDAQVARELQGGTFRPIDGDVNAGDAHAALGLTPPEMEEHVVIDPDFAEALRLSLEEQSV